MLETEGLTIRFGGHVAVDRVSCRFEPGTLTAIVGPNGAGKTTYFNLISGQLKASAGSVRLGGHDITQESASARTYRGLGRAFQLTQLFPNLSVLENVRLAVQSKRKQGLDLWSVWSDKRETLARAEALVERVQLHERRDAAASSLPHGDQRKLEVAMLMALEPSVFMFDEPTAGMSTADVPVILDLVRALKADKAKTILLVEHKMDVVRELADRIVVLHNGQLVADGEPEEVIASPIVQQAYLGIAKDPSPQPSPASGRGSSASRSPDTSGTSLSPDGESAGVRGDT
jgi:branched-chain amino acid transport system ATP-binding protein